MQTVRAPVQRNQKMDDSSFGQNGVITQSGCLREEQRFGLSLFANALGLEGEVTNKNDSFGKQIPPS